MKSIYTKEQDQFSAKLSNDEWFMLYTRIETEVLKTCSTDF